MKMKAIELAIDAGADELALHHSLAAPRVVEKAMASGLPVVVWTVDRPSWIRRAVRTGVHALITNHPVVMLAARAQAD
jgi:glycerophosphoryl diester phosphodiesterase